MSVRGVTPGEESVFEAWREAIKKSLDSADDAAGTILTAAFSLATAYGALIGLVAPDDDPGPILLGLPILFFAAGAVFALLAKTRGVEVSTTSDVDRIVTSIKGAVDSKRFRASWAIGVMVAGIVVAAAVIVFSYAGSPEPVSVTARLTDLGISSLTDSCRGAADGLTGDLESVGDFVVLKVAADECTDIETVQVAKAQVLALVETPS
jgi:hypothetical protein